MVTEQQPKSIPLFEKYARAVKNEGDELTSFLYEQWIKRFQAKERINQLMPTIARRAVEGDFTQLEDLDNISKAQLLVENRYKMFYSAVTATGALNIHLADLQNDSPPEENYLRRKEESLRMISDNVYINPLTPEQQKAYSRTKKAVQQAKEVIYPTAKTPEPTTSTLKPVEIDKESQKQPEETKELEKPEVIINLTSFGENELIYINRRPVAITDDTNLILEALSHALESDMTRGELWKKLRYGSVNNEVLDKLIGEASKAFDQAGLSDVLVTSVGNRTTYYYLDTDTYKIEFERIPVAAEVTKDLREQTIKTNVTDEKIEDESQEEIVSPVETEELAKKTFTLSFAEDISINGIKYDFTSGESRLLKTISETDDFLTSKALAEETGIAAEELKDHLTALAATLSRIAKEPFSIESRRGRKGGYRLKGAPLLVTSFNTNEPVEARKDAILEEGKREEELSAVDFTNNQSSAILGASTYYYLTKVADDVIQELGQDEYEELIESCRQLSLQIRAKKPTPQEFAHQARLQTISLDEYKLLRTRIIESIQNVKKYGHSETLSEDQNKIISWFVGKDEIELNGIINQFQYFDDIELKSELNLYANSWQNNSGNAEDLANQQNIILTDTKLRELSPAIADAINVVSTKIVPNNASLTAIERLFKEPGKKIAPVNKPAIQFALREKIIGKSGSITKEDLQLLSFLYVTIPGKTLRRSLSGKPRELAAACEQIRQEMQKYIKTE